MNERIDHSNYEAWLLDRLEGTLTPEQERELDAFLLKHPELAFSEEPLPSVTSIAQALSAAEKDALKKSLPPVGVVDNTSVDDHLIARLENDLTADQREALRIYLLDHPEQQRAERIYALTKLVPEALAYAEKRGLQRHFPPLGMPTAFNVDDFLVARLEGDLNREQEEALDRFIAQDKAHQRAWAVMQATRSSAAPIVFADKQGLKKKERRVIPFALGTWTVRLAAAASVAVLIGIGLWYLRTPNAHEQEIARVPAKTSTSEERSSQDEVPVTDAERVHENSNGQRQENVVPENSKDASVPVAPQREQPALPMRVEPAEEPVLAQDAPPAVNEPVVVPETPSAESTENLAATPPTRKDAPVNEQNTTTLGELFASTVRDRVLDKPAREEHNLDGEDAIAMVDRTLKVVGGERAGLEVGQKAQNGTRRFDLRLGRNFSISASR